MIPLRDTNRSEVYPIVNSCIIAVTILAFIIELFQGQGLEEFIYLYGLVPARYAEPEIASYFTTGQQIIPFLTFMFLHGGFFHLLGNMWFLYIFGDNVEDRLGHLRYLIFYMLCGLSSGASHLIINWQSNVPTIGASGAIAGVMGAYLILYPRAKVLTLIPIFFLPYFIEIPAFFFLGIWFLFQFLSAAVSAGQEAGGVAWWAHIGGFVFGIVFLKLLEMMPKGKMNERIQRLTKKRTTPRLQVIHPVDSGDSLDLYGFISVSEREARLGGRKLINVAHGQGKKTFFVHIPAGVTGGTMLRLRSMGSQATGASGDLYLKVQITR
ncbi:MAG: rhomboid family intramembrane serine protease [Deltaproteobacteria bacterium]|nr:rhomboid family intramembrane serine protease [Deltaproteobacteria bacterium]